VSNTAPSGCFWGLCTGSGRSVLRGREFALVSLRLHHSVAIAVAVFTHTTSMCPACSTCHLTGALLASTLPPAVPITFSPPCPHLLAAVSAAILLGVEPGLLHGSPREEGCGFQPVTEHVHACHAKWLCRTLRALLQAATAGIARNPAKIILPDATDLPGGVGPPRQGPDPTWLPLVTKALKVCNPSMPPLQTLLCAASFTPTDRALGWFTDVEGQTYLLPCGFLQLIAGTIGALGGMLQQSQIATNHAAPLFKQDAVRSLLLFSSLSRAHLVSLGQSLVWGGHSVGKPMAVCEHDCVREPQSHQLEGTRALRWQRHTQHVQQDISG
jgi:hypothetical protein